MTIWTLTIALAVAIFCIKAVGPAVMAGRSLPPALLRVVTLLAPALLAALVVTTALADGSRLQLGARSLGVAVAAVLLLRGVSVLPAVLVAAAVTALVRQL